MMNRRDFIALAAAGASVLRAKERIGRSRISAISDEVATSPDEAIAFAKQYGLEWLELRTVPGAKKPYFFLEPDELKPAARQFTDNGIRISFLNTDLLKFGFPGTEPVGRKKETPEALAKRLPREQAKFDSRMDDLRKCIRAAHAFGTVNVRVFTFSRVAEPAKLLPRIVDVLEPMAKVAETEGVRLLIENETSPKRCFLRRNCRYPQAASAQSSRYKLGCFKRGRRGRAGLPGWLRLPSKGSYLECAVERQKYPRHSAAPGLGDDHSRFGERRLQRGAGSRNPLLRRDQYREGPRFDEGDDAHRGGILDVRLLVLIGVGVLLVAAVVFGIFSSTEGSHLQLQGQVLKARTGALADTDSVAVLDFRVKNPSNRSFIVRTIKLTLEKADGQKEEGSLVSKTDMKQLFQYNRFLGSPYNDALSLRDQVPAHGQVDRMVAARFDVPATTARKL